MSELAWRGSVIDQPHTFRLDGVEPLLAFTLRVGRFGSYRVVARGSNALDAAEVIKVNPDRVMVTGELLADGRINATAIGLRLDFEG